MTTNDEQQPSTGETPTETDGSQSSHGNINESANRLAPFNPTSDQVQQTALKLLDLDKDDVLIDLGCGDARILLTAANQIQGLRCVGIEMDPVYSSRAIEAVRKISLETRKRIEIRQGDVLELGYASVGQPKASDTSGDSGELCQNLTFLNDCSALYLFLVPDGLKKIRPLLDRVVAIRKDQRQSFRVVAYMFQIHGWEPTQVDRSSKGNVPLYLYRFEAS